jgi:phage N-6-adenine-methyltransferase
VTERWRTPPEIFDRLAEEFPFDLDAAADADMSCCARSLDDALHCEWKARYVWLNPPYGKKLEPFVRKAYTEWKKGNAETIVALIPFRCRAAWWHECVIGKAEEVRCVRKRPHFLREDGTRPKFTGSCDSCVILWRRPAQFTKLVSL